MTLPRGELTTYRARGGHATDWANPPRFALKKSFESSNETCYNAVQNFYDNFILTCGKKKITWYTIVKQNFVVNLVKLIF